MSLYRIWLLLALLVFAATYEASAGQVVSTMRNVNAVMQARGFYIVPTGSQAASYGTRDLAPVQTFEIVRPRGERITIGRLHTSCTCVQLESPKTTFESGERAILNLRNVIATPPGGQTYAIYVQITSPIRTTLRFDTFVQSSQFVASSSAPISSGSGIEIIIPTAEGTIVKKEGETEEAEDTPDTAEGEAKEDSDAEESSDAATTEEPSADQQDAAAEKADAEGGEAEAAGDKAVAESADKAESDEKAPVADDETPDAEAKEAKEAGDAADAADNADSGAEAVDG